MSKYGEMLDFSTIEKFISYGSIIRLLCQTLICVGNMTFLHNQENQIFLNFYTEWVAYEDDTQSNR